jgi:hypothetical protein
MEKNRIRIFTSANYYKSEMIKQTIEIIILNQINL